MNVKLVYADRVESWDTRADGSATTSHAALEVRGNRLVLWSALDFDGGYAEDGSPQERRRERGTPRAILSIGETGPTTLPDFLAVAHDDGGLLRLDIDGETVYQFEPTPQDDFEGSSDALDDYLPAQ